MNNLIFKYGLGAITVLLLAGSLTAKPYKRSKWLRRRLNLKVIKRVLDNEKWLQKHGVTVEQKTKAQALIENWETRSLKERIRKGAEIHILEVDLKRELEKKNPDKEAVYKILQKISTYDLDMQKMQFGFLIDLKAVFSQKQFEKIERTLQHQRQKFHKKFRRRKQKQKQNRRHRSKRKARRRR